MRIVERLENRRLLTTFCEAPRLLLRTPTPDVENQQWYVALAVDPKFDPDEEFQWVNHCTLEEPLTIDDGNGREVTFEIGHSFRWEETFGGTMHNNPLPVGINTITARIGDKVSTVEIEILDRVLTHGPWLEIDVLTQTSITKNPGWDRGDFIDVGNIISSETFQKNVGKYGILTYENGEFRYDFTGEPNFIGTIEEEFVVSTEDDEGNVVPVVTKIFLKGNPEIVDPVDPPPPVYAPGDVNQDGHVNRSDLLLFFEDPSNYEESPQFMRDKFEIPLGDVTFDGVFNSTDLVIMFQYGKYESFDPAPYRRGDMNLDGLFDSGDLVKMFEAGQYT